LKLDSVTTERNANNSDDLSKENKTLLKDLRILKRKDGEYIPWEDSPISRQLHSKSYFQNVLRKSWIILDSFWKSLTKERAIKRLGFVSFLLTWLRWDILTTLIDGRKLLMDRN
jgi:hypothetical protein